MVLAFMIGCVGFAQSIDYNTKKGYAANGYDVVAYFDNKALEGSKEYIGTYDGIKYKFHSAKNAETFKANPSKYIPLYGGYCAYAMATRSDKVSPDPETFEIRDGSLLLFYTSWTTNTYKYWKKENPEILKPKADKNWEKVKNK